MASLTAHEQTHQLRALCAAMLFLVSARLMYGLVVDHLWILLGVVCVKCSLIGGLLYLLPRVAREERAAELPVMRSSTLFLVLLTVLSMTTDLAVALVVH